MCRVFDPVAAVIAAADESMIQQKYCAAEHQLSWRTRERKTVTFIPLKVGTLSSRRRSPSIGAHWPLFASFTKSFIAATFADFNVFFLCFCPYLLNYR